MNSLLGPPLEASGLGWGGTAQDQGHCVIVTMETATSQQGT